MEAFFKAICQNFVIGPGAYLKDPWNRFDFLLVIIALMTWLLELFANFINASFLKSFRAFRALRPLRLVARN